VQFDGNDNSGTWSRLIRLATREESLPQANCFQVGGFCPRVIERTGQPRDDVDQKVVHAEFGLRADADAGVEPTQFGLAVGVDVVIDVEYAAAELSFLGEQFDERLATCPRAGRDFEDRTAGIVFIDELFQFFHFARVELVDCG